MWGVRCRATGFAPIQGLLELRTHAALDSYGRAMHRSKGPPKRRCVCFISSIPCIWGDHVRVNHFTLYLHDGRCPPAFYTVSSPGFSTPNETSGLVSGAMFTSFASENGTVLWC